MVGGYIMVDCKGLNINSLSAVTVSGLSKALGEAMKSGKPIFVKNLVKDTSVSGVTTKISPVPAVVCAGESGIHVMSFAAFYPDYRVNITVTALDAATPVISGPAEDSET